MKDNSNPKKTIWTMTSQKAKAFGTGSGRYAKNVKLL